MIQDAGNTNIKKFEQCFYDMPKSDKFKYDSKLFLAIRKRKEGFLTNITHEILNGLKKVTHFITQHIFISISLLFGLLLLV